MRSIRIVAAVAIFLAPLGCAETDGQTVTIGPGQGAATAAPVPMGPVGEQSQSLEVSDASIAGEMGRVQFAGEALAEWALHGEGMYSMGLSVLDSSGYALTMIDFQLDLAALVGAGPQTFAFGARLEDGVFEEGPEAGMTSTGDNVAPYFNVTGCSGPASGEVEWDVPSDEVTVEVAPDADDPELLVVTFSASFPDARGVQVTDGSFSIPIAEVSSSISTDRTRE